MSNFLRSRKREEVRAKVESARKKVKGITVAPVAMEAITELADAIEILADVCEELDQ